MAVKQPNTICKNQNCHNGKDGGRKHYYTCRYCVHTENWRAMACSEECYAEYIKQIQASRTSGESVDQYPIRTDMSHEEVVQLVERSDFAQVVTETNDELADEIEEFPDKDYAGIVDAINLRLDSQLN